MTCTGGISSCTSCEVSASPPRFLREDDSYCVLDAECDQTATYYWDTTGETCAGNIVCIRVNYAVIYYWEMRRDHMIYCPLTF